MSALLMVIITLVPLVASLISDCSVSPVCQLLSILLRLSSSTSPVVDLGHLLVQAGANLTSAADFFIAGPFALLSAIRGFSATVFGALVHVDRQRAAGLWLAQGLAHTALTVLFIFWAFASGYLSSAPAAHPTSTTISAVVSIATPLISDPHLNDDGDPHLNDDGDIDCPSTPHLSPSTSSTSSFDNAADDDEDISDGDSDDGEEACWTMDAKAVAEAEAEYRQARGQPEIAIDYDAPPFAMVVHDSIFDEAPPFACNDEEIDFDWERKRMARNRRRPAPTPPPTSALPPLPSLPLLPSPPFKSPVAGPYRPVVWHFALKENARWRRAKAGIERRSLELWPVMEE